MSRKSSVAASASILAGVAAVCTTLVAGTYQLTAERIIANEDARLKASLQLALGELPYDGDLGAASIELFPPHGLPGNAPALVYPVYAAGLPAAVLFAVTADDGYAGPIRVLIGIRADGKLSGLEILEHSETPGLGDRISSQRSDWARQFSGRSLGNPAVESWAIRVDGGEFDQLTGASVTPRAVIRAIRDTLIYFQSHRQELFAMPASEYGS